MKRTKLIYIEGGDERLESFYLDYLKNYSTEEIVHHLPIGTVGMLKSNNQYLEHMFYMPQDSCITVITNNPELMSYISVDYRKQELSDELWIWTENKGLFNVQNEYPNIRKENNLLRMYLSNLFE